MSVTESESAISPVSPRIDLDFITESIVVQIRWSGVVMGYVLVACRTAAIREPIAVSAILALGAGYAAADTFHHRRGRVFLRRWPLFVSVMEAIFLALLCYYDTGPDSPFRWYYLLSLICCAVRYPARLAWSTLAIHGTSLAIVTAAFGADRSALASLVLIVAMLGWVTWAVASLAGLLRITSERLQTANQALERHGADLERRVAERTEALRVSQARMIHQEKMAAFGLLAAGIAHEVGNPLAALSSLVQMLQRRGPDPYTSSKLALAHRQLARIQRIIHELSDFSRPGSTVQGLISLPEVVDEALGIAKYYQRTKQRRIANEYEPNLPMVRAARDPLIQVILNLLLNAADATGPNGRITLRLRRVGPGSDVELQVEDNGRGIQEADRSRLFQPFFTTKPRGTGLGLYISRQIIEELSGTLTYRTTPDVGTTFTIRLKARAVPPESAADEPAEETDDERSRGETDALATARAPGTAIAPRACSADRR